MSYLEFLFATAPNSLEWATSCPPPRHNFTSLPRICSERPAFELHYPHMVERMRREGHVTAHDECADTTQTGAPEDDHAGVR